jgi:hypothetical protein
LRVIVTVTVSFILACLISGAAEAQLVITPTAPDSGDRITADVQVPGLCDSELTTTTTGTNIRTTVNLFACVSGPPPFPVSAFAEFGPLPAGSYEYEVYFDYEDEPPQLVYTRTVIVTPAMNRPDVPTLQFPAFVALLASVAIAGIATLRRG